MAEPWPARKEENGRPRAQAEARARLLEHAGKARAGRRLRPGRIAVWGAGVVAVCAAAALVLVPAVRDDDGGGPVAKARRTADGVLLAAADAADRQPPENGRYLHTSSRETELVSAGTERSSFLVVEDRVTDHWQAARPARDGSLVWTRRLGTRPLSAEDEQAWKAAGSPARVAGLSWTGRPKVELRQAGAWKRSRVEVGKSASRAKVGTLGSAKVTLGRLNALPADAGELRASLLGRYRGGEAGTDLWLFGAARDLLDGSLPVRPEVRAAAYRMMAGLGGVALLGPAQDGRGRPGTAIAFDEPGNERGLVRHTLIVDEGTGRLLEAREMMLNPSRAYAKIPEGTVYDSVVYDHEWTDARPAVPRS
ncbi:CU044_5270 family protein [Actinocorallia populi]|uniref:CU044_5270 family protein n=1 Tax=Actinocorallia populi TaxID=2079200 RepID=UPI000D08870C|nr:CU044_5270 family protein [Actinocorallia populi]